MNKGSTQYAWCGQWPLSRGGVQWPLRLHLHYRSGSLPCLDRVSSASNTASCSAGTGSAEALSYAQHTSRAGMQSLAINMLSHTAECVRTLVACWLGVRHAAAPLHPVHSQSLQSQPSCSWLVQSIRELSEALVSQLRCWPANAVLQLLPCSHCRAVAVLQSCLALPSCTITLRRCCALLFCTAALHAGLYCILQHFLLVPLPLHCCCLALLSCPAVLHCSCFITFLMSRHSCCPLLPLLMLPTANAPHVQHCVATISLLDTVLFWVGHGSQPLPTASAELQLSHEHRIVAWVSHLEWGDTGTEQG